MLMSANRQLTNVPFDLVVAALAGPARITSIAARAGPDLEGVSEAKFQSDGPEHRLATIRRADEKDRVVPGSGDHQGPLCHFVAVDDAGRVVAVDSGLRSPGDFVGGLTVQGGQFAVGEGQEIHGLLPKWLIVEHGDQEFHVRRIVDQSMRCPQQVAVGAVFLRPLENLLGVQAAMPCQSVGKCGQHVARRWHISNRPSAS